MVSAPQARLAPSRDRLYELVKPVLPAYLVSRSVVLAVAILLQWLLDTGRANAYGYIGKAPLSTLTALFDANWYASITTGGYQVSAPLDQQTNIHFMPLYPFLMRVAGMLLGLGEVVGGYNIAGVLLSHVFFLIALVLLYKLTLEVWGDESLATRSVWLMAVFPWSFVFSLAYTESLFLMLILWALLIAWRMREEPLPWRCLALGMLLALASLTRHHGLLMAAGAAWLVAIHPRHLSWAARVRNALLAALPAVVVFAGFVLYIGLQTGELLAVLTAHGAWGKGYWNDLPLLLVLPPANPAWSMYVLSTIGLVALLVLTVGSMAMFYSDFKKRNSQPFSPQRVWPGAWAFVWCTLPFVLYLLTSMTANQSWGRYLMSLFPCIWAAAWWLKSQRPYTRFIQVSLVMQCVFFSAAVLLQVTP
ncbi:MAG: hypothetical protein M3437_19320 [Chloroflexota bacterium]|nr:hypothetical protein [Chloroflexota bacterium]MDQ5866674.1 hypothetical protein [Chloroflexota bacterium]